MGCCHSSQRREVANQEVSPSLVNVKSIESSREPISGIQTFVSSAGWVADATHGDYVRFSLDGPRLFACLFDAHTTHEAAAFSAAHCHDIFLSCLIDSKTEPVQAIEQTFEELDRQFLNSNLSAETRAVSACSGIIVYLDFSKSKGWIGNVGTAQCLVGISEGSFNARRTDAHVLSTLHDSQNPIEQEDLKERFPTDVDLFETIDGFPYVKGITRLSRTIGYGFAKEPRFTTLYNETSKRKLFPLPEVSNPYLLCQPQVMEIDISENAENLVLYSEGLGQLLSPAEIAVFTNVFDKKCLNQLTEIICGTGFSSNAQPAQEYMESLMSPASALTRYAVSKAADQIDALMRTYHETRNNEVSQITGRERWNIEHVKSLKVKDPASTNNSSGLDELLISRGDLMKNLSCVVIALDKLNSRRSIPMDVHFTQPRVQYGWKLLYCYCKFHVERRRACLRRWWQLIAAVVRDTQRRILQAEKENWINHEIEMLNGTEGEASSGFDDSPAAVNDRTTSFPCTISPGFRRWLSSAPYQETELVDLDRFQVNGSLIL